LALASGAMRMLSLPGATRVAPRGLAAQTAGSEPHSADGLQREVAAQIRACALRYANRSVKRPLDPAGGWREAPKRARSPGFVRKGLCYSGVEESGSAV